MTNTELAEIGAEAIGANIGPRLPYRTEPEVRWYDPAEDRVAEIGWSEIVNLGALIYEDQMRREHEYREARARDVQRRVDAFTAARRSEQ